jgi:hypothetical protein
MATPTSGAQREMQEKIVVESATDENLFTSSEMRTVPRVGETFKIGDEEYTVNSVEHSITDDLKNHLIRIRVD